MAFVHHVVALDAWVEPPALNFEHTLQVIRDGSALTKPEQLKDATIVINTATPVNEDLLQHMPKLQLIAGTGAGFDHVNTESVRARGITLCNIPAQNTGMLVLLHAPCLD